MTVFRHIEQSRGRISTGFATLDAITRGGLPFGKIVIAAGMPGAGKTGWLTQLALHFARAGARVRILATDEGADAIAVRLGQQCGAERGLLERRDANALAQASRTLDPLDLDVVTARTIEDASSELLGAEKPILILDSLQTVTCKASLDRRSKKAKVEAVVEAVKTLRDRGVLVLCTSELARDQYKNLKKDPSVGGAKGSGDIEYQADMLLALVTRDGGKTVDVTVPKSRIGAKDGWSMTWDADRARFSEGSIMLSTSSAQPGENASSRWGWGSLFWAGVLAWFSWYAPWIAWPIWLLVGWGFYTGLRTYPEPDSDESEES